MEWETEMLARNGWRWREETGRGQLFLLLLLFLSLNGFLLSQEFHLGLHTARPSNSPRMKESALSYNNFAPGSFTSFLKHSASGSAPVFSKTAGHIPL